MLSDNVRFLTILFFQMSGKVCFEQQHTIVLMVPSRFHVAPHCCGLIFVEIAVSKRGGDGEDNLLTYRNSLRIFSKVSVGGRERDNQLTISPLQQVFQLLYLGAGKAEILVSTLLLCHHNILCNSFFRYFLFFWMRIFGVAYKRQKGIAADTLLPLVPLIRMRGKTSIFLDTFLHIVCLIRGKNVESNTIIKSSIRLAARK